MFESLADQTSAAADPGTASPVRALAEAKVVRKPWGEERWLLPESAPFALKVIRIRAGQRTSLQYHERKEEANLVVEGEGTLWFAERVGEPPTSRRLRAGDMIHIKPGQVHRIEAATDTTLVEVSTPELDDVVRISDDEGRGNGRIDSEHG